MAEDEESQLANPTDDNQADAEAEAEAEADAESESASNHFPHTTNEAAAVDADLDPNDPNYPQPTSHSRISLQRPKQEKQIDKKDFKNRRKAIQKRLSAKQRMPFDQIVSRNIHAGLEDELNEKRPMEKSKKILQLNRRLSHRPHPSDIQQDEELPPDLKKADSEYYKLYKYRQATERDIDDGTNDEVRPPRDRTTSDPNPPNKPVTKIIKPATGQTSIENPLDWKFGQRSSAKELQIRGIIPEQYADVVHGDKSLEEAKAEWERYRKQSQLQIKNKIDLKFRPSKQDLVDRNIVPDWENPHDHVANTKQLKKRNTDMLKMKLMQRMDPDEAEQRAIISKDELFSNKDYDEIRKEKKEATKQLKSKMRASITQRADKSEIVFRGIVPREYLDDDPDVAKNKIRSQRVSVKQQMNEAFANRPAPDDVTRLLLNAAESNEAPQPYQPPIPLFTAAEKLRSPDGTGPLPTTPEYEEVDDDDGTGYDFPTFLDRMKQEKKQTSQTLETHMRRRSTVEDLQQRGILPLNQSSGDYDADAEIPSLRDRIATQADDDSEDDEEFTSFLDRMKQERKEHRKSIQQLHRRRPTIEDLKQRGIYKDIDVLENLETKQPQVYMSDEYANSLNKSQAQRDADDEDDVPEAEIDETSDDDSQDEYPTFLDRKRQESKQIKKKLKAFHKRRPSKQDMEDRGIVERGYFENMQVVLDKKRQRRQSFTTELATFFQQRPDIAEMMTKGLVAAEFIGMDSVEMKQKRKAIKQTLNRKLNKKRRPTMDELEMRGIVPSGYFHDAQKAVSTKHVRRITAEKELSGFLPKRMDPKKMFERGMIPQQHFQNIMGMTIPIPTMVQVSPEMFPDHQVQIEEVNEDEEEDDDDESSSDGVMEAEKETAGGDEEEMRMNKQQQAFSAGAMGVADGMPVVTEPHDHHQSGGHTLQIPKKRHSQRVSGIANVVLDLPQHAERNVFDHDSWTQNLYESLLNSLRFGQIPQRIEKAKRDENNANQLQSIMTKYQEFERMHHTRMNGLLREKKIILDQIAECDQKENESLETLKNLMTEHSELEQKIRPQMKMLLHKMTLVETRILRLDQKGDQMTEQDKLLKQEYEKELNYYDTYITELKNVFIHTNNIRAKYQNSIRTVIEHKAKLQTSLQQKEQEIESAKVELNKKFQEFHAWINSVLTASNGQNDDNPNSNQRALVLHNNRSDQEQKYDPLASDPITDLTKVLNERNQNIDDNLDLLSFRISTIPATDYALRVIELCQLSYIYSNENLKSFFEWFIRFAVQSFIEINYAHTCFTTQNRKAIDNEINQLKSIQFIANLTPTPEDNKQNFDAALFDNLTVIVSYLELLPSNNDGGVTPNNNIDHEYVIFHVARYLTADFNFSQTLGSEKTAEDDIPQIAQSQVEKWISVILQSSKASLAFSADYNQLTNANMDKPRDMIKATRLDSAARIRPARAAAIVMDHVYGIHVDG